MSRPPRIAGRLNQRLGAMVAEVRTEVRRSIRRGALAIESTAVESIMEQTPGGRAYRSRGKKGAIHYAAPAGSAPNADTGELHTGITSAIVEDTAAQIAGQTASNAPYGEALEFGTSKMEPRPFMGPAFGEHRDVISADIAAAVQRGIRRATRR